MAVSENSTVLPVARRHLFAAIGLPALLVAPLPSGRPAPTGSPAPKIALALADLRAAQADLDGIEARFADLPEDRDNPDLLAAEFALGTADSRLCDAVDDLAEAAAASLADVRAKAEALRVALRNGALYQLNAPPERQGEAHDRLAWSLARDVLALLLAGRG